MLQQLYHRCRRGFVMRPLAGSLTAFSAAQGVSLAAGLLLHATAARFLTVADYGRLAVTHSVLLVMLVALNHGIPNALRRAVSLEPALLGAAWRRLLTLHLPLAVGAAVLVAVGAPWAAILFGDPLLTDALRVVAADVALRAGVVEPGWLLLNGAGRHRLQAALMATHSLCRCAAVAGVLALGYGLIGAVTGMVLASALNVLLVVNVLPVRSHRHPKREREGTNEELADAAGYKVGRDRRAISDSPFAVKDLLRWLRLAPAANLIHHVAVAGNLWLAKALTSDAEAVGVYAACYMLASTLLPTSAILSATCFRRVAGLVQSEPAAAAKILRTVLGGACLLTFVSIIAISLCGGPLLRFVFGDAFAGATRLLLLIWLGMTGTALTWFFCEMLAAAQALTVRLWAAIWSGIGSAVATTVLLPLGGLPGAAAGLLVGSILGVVLSGAALYRIVGGLWPTMPFMNRVSPNREDHSRPEESP